MTMIVAPERGSEYRILGVISVGHGMSHLYYLVLPPLFMPLRAAFDVSYAELGMLLAVMSMASALLQVAFGFMVDRTGARVMLLGGLLVLSIATALMGLATNFWQLLVLSFVAGAGNAVFHPTDYAILNASISPGRMGRAFSVHTFAGNVGSAASPVVMIGLAQAFGWRAALVIVGLAGLLGLALLASQWSAMREDIAASTRKAEAGPEATAFVATWSVVFSRPMMLFFVFFAVLAMMQTGMQSFVATALVALHETPLTTANLALSAYLVASAAGVLIGGEVSDRTTRHDIIAVLVLVASAFFALALAWFNLQAAVLVTLMALIGIGQGATRPARDMMLRAATPKGATGSVFGFVTSGILVGSALAPIPLGWLLDIGRPVWVFYGLALLMAVAVAVMVAQQACTRTAAQRMSKLA